MKSAAELVAFYAKLQKKYPIISIEDGCDENDWAGWKLLTDKIGDKTQLATMLFAADRDVSKWIVFAGASLALVAGTCLPMTSMAMVTTTTRLSYLSVI